MPNRRGSHAPRALVVFSSTHQIEEAALNRAIAGGIASGSQGAASFEQREELAAETRLALVEHFAAGKRVVGNLTSLAYRIAFNKTCDVFRRTRADALARRREGEAAEIAYEIAPCNGEAAEARLARLGETAMQAALLRRGLKRISATDRATLVAMLQRAAPLPRTTPAERKIANAAAQAEKRAKDRLRKAVRDMEGEREM